MKHYPNIIPEFSELLKSLKTTDEVILACNQTVNSITFEKIKRPIFPSSSNATQKEFDNYRKELEAYSSMVAIQDEKKKEKELIDEQIDAMLKRRLIEILGFDNVPEQYRNNVLNYIKDNISDFSYSQFVNEVSNLLNIFATKEVKNINS